MNFKLELKTEADLEIRSSDEISTKTYQQTGTPKDVSFSQTFQIKNVLRSPVDKNTAKVCMFVCFRGSTSFITILLFGRCHITHVHPTYI